MVKWPVLDHQCRIGANVKAMFTAIGVGYSSSLPSAAALNWKSAAVMDDACRSWYFGLSCWLCLCLCWIQDFFFCVCCLVVVCSSNEDSSLGIPSALLPDILHMLCH
ncbi:hypothetical protein P8452_51883 [Trifolium repens]|nr:hypothetical protein P8452_51883 [Trifolium repens]